MKRKIVILSVILIFSTLFIGCSKTHKEGFNEFENNIFGNGAVPDEIPNNVDDLGNDDTSFGTSIEDLGAYKGYFEEEIADVTVTCISGTQDSYKLEGNTLTFGAVSEDSVYSLSGKLRGNIVIDIGDEHKFELELQGFSLVSEKSEPIKILSGNEVSLKAKNGYENYVYDMRQVLDENETEQVAGAVYSEVDLEISGKGKLYVVSENNNGIRSKDDLQVKNLELTVICVDNALKGNDSVEIVGGKHTLIASAGDGIKTSKSDVSEKGNQRGNVSICEGAVVDIYSACDGIDAAYDIVIDGEDTQINVYTDKYSNYSKEVTATSSDGYYIRFTSDQYSYSVKYYNSDDDFVWVNPEYHSSVSGGRNKYYYYSFPRMNEYSKMQFFIYSSDMEQGQDSEYIVASEHLTPNSAYDTFALESRGGMVSYSWTNYTTSIQDGGFGGMGGPGSMGGPGGMGGHGGPGGMNEGNSNKGSYSTKGLKAANEIKINAGILNIKSYDDSIHAGSDSVLENGENALGNISINGGTLTLYSNDDGLHADGTVTTNAGTVCVTNSYEGVEGSIVNIGGGYLSIKASDDGINSTATSGAAINISAGTVYIYCNGDGIDSNSRSSYEGIIFSGGNVIVISNSSGNSAIDTEQGYTYTGGKVIAIMPRGGMSNEATACKDFSSIGNSQTMSLGIGKYLVAKIGDATATVTIPCNISGLVITLGDASAEISQKDSTELELDANGICWN